MVQDQKLRIAKNGRHLCLLRNQVHQITTLCESEIQQPNQSVLYSRLTTLKEVYSFVIMTMEQFELLLKSYPKRNASGVDDASETIAFDNAICDSALGKCFKYDAAWLDVNEKVKQMLSVSNKQKNNLNKLTPSLPSVYTYKKTEKLVNNNILCQPHIMVMDEASGQLKDLSNKLTTLINSFKMDPDNQENIQNPVSNCLVDLHKYMSKQLINLKPFAEENSVISEVEEVEMVQETSLESFSIRVEGCVSFILYAIQEMYKKYLKDNTKDEAENNTIDDENEAVKQEPTEEDEESDQIIQDGHLKKELQENIRTDIADLNIPKLINKLDKIMSELHLRMDTNDKNVAECKKQLSRCVPLLEQITLLAQYFITQQVAMHRVSCKMLSVLLNIFHDLTTKG